MAASLPRGSEMSKKRFAPRAEQSSVVDKTTDVTRSDDPDSDEYVISSGAKHMSVKDKIVGPGDSINMDMLNVGQATFDFWRERGVIVTRAEYERSMKK